jgi:hypothetical protein
MLRERRLKDRRHVSIRKPLPRPLVRLYIKVSGLRRAFEVSEKARVVGCAHSLPAFGDKTDYGHIARL